MYRTASSAWLVQDVRAPTERSTVLLNLKRGTEYEIKIRPYFDEFQGMDSEAVFVRTPEEAPSGAPRAVTVATIGSSNSSSISVSWDPPPAEEQNGIIQEYWVSPDKSTALSHGGGLVGEGGGGRRWREGGRGWGGEGVGLRADDRSSANILVLISRDANVGI
uniref:Fibronectin type-III domain-containing protein n=1 Tax=Callorhinchus milii TaxID=7868 RepID=A0A4W3H5C9_CALMI